ncbi:tripartite motif-containing protein bonus [Aphomia sociella]
MENINYQPSGEEIERALMDLGPLLGVTIKEEVQDELPDATAGPPSSLNVGGVAESTGSNNVSGVTGAAALSGAAPAGSETEAGADSLASPSAARPPLSAARCVLCQNSLALTEGTPKLMECLHSACEPCIAAKIEERTASSRDFLGAERITITCPSCRLQCQPANMIDQRFVLEKMALEQTGNNGAVGGEQQCNSCDDTEPATSYCVDCAEFICDNCVHAHQRLKITKDHTIKSKEEAAAELGATQPPRAAHDMYCRDHVQERLSLFCETCDRLTCRDCQLQHHRDHKYQFSTEMAAQARASIAGLLSEVNYKRVLLGSAMKVIRDRQQLIADKKKALVHDITQTVVKLTNAINTRGKQLVLRLNEVCDAKQRTLSEKKEALQQLAGVTEHCVEFVGAALEQGSDTALLHAKRLVAAQLQRVKSRRADIPNPEIPVRIGLALDKLPDLVRVLSGIGAIVVDGKVDGAGGAGAGAQGPYHPPAPAPPAPAPPAPPAPPAASAHSAVVALQHVAMHQATKRSNEVFQMLPSPIESFCALPSRSCSYPTAESARAHERGVSGAVVRAVRGRGRGGCGWCGGASGYLSPLQQQMRLARPHTPLRHPHVTSTTHPHHLHGMNEMNLRGLLSAQAVQAQAQQHQQMQHQQHQHQQHQQHVQPAAKWHIPQQNLANGSFELAPMSAAGGGGLNDFKITLARPPQRAPPTPTTPTTPSVVTSTNPKTPSPSLNGGAMELDKVCAESVQDLMATIAKLDSNGVQVVAEGAAPAPPPASPARVHSSTGEAGAGASRAVRGTAPADPNEDWCAVCMDGGELMCCDKCPKVFHQYCHIPTIEKLPDETETWQCLLCVNFAEGGEEGEAGAAAGAEAEGAEALSARQLKLVERITLELYCQYEPSLAFREPVPPDNLHYHAKIARPMCLDAIRMKLQPRAALRYTHVAQFVADCRLLFRNAYQYNAPESSIYKDAKRLEEFFDAQLLKWLPEYAYWSGEGEPANKRPRIE